MSRFSDMPFHARLNKMGDWSEQRFEELFPRHARTGLNRPNLNVSALTQHARYTPDYLTDTGYVEVMGIGRQAALSLKWEKAESLVSWGMIAPVDLFVADSHKRRWWRAPLSSWLECCVEKGSPARFPEGKLYWSLQADDFPVAPTPIPR